MNIGVFCSASDINETYIGPTKELIRLLAKGKHTLVYGGSDKGLMKVVADMMQENGGKIIGITFEFLKPVLRANLDEVVVEKDLPARKASMLKRSDAIVVLPGGIGTLDEVTEVLELKKHHFHNKPVVIFNIQGFYEGLRTQFLRMEKEGFTPHPLEDLISFADTPEAVMQLLG